MTLFKTYRTIASQRDADFIEKIKLDPDLMNDTWYVTEKAHGANFCFVVTDTEIHCARRKAILKPGEKFYGHTEIVTKYESRIQALQKEVGGVIYIYGELLGGYYPGVDCVSKPVQKGVFYCGDYDFYTFDIMVEDKFMDYDRAIELFEKYDFVYAKPLVQGTFTQCLEFDPEFESVIPQWFGMEPMQNNRAEGVVIKPNRFATISDSRVAIKIKSQTYMECTLKPQIGPMEDHIKLAVSYVCENRLNNFQSKLLENQRDANILIRGLTADAIRDFYKENPRLSKELTKRHKNNIMDSVRAAARELVNSVSILN